jgi:serine/threonine-protein kinase
MSEGSAPLAPGVIVAETYEVERLLGRGGMGEVWLARHRRLAGKQVAIKVLHVDRALPAEALARFRREAEIAARLEHPNIVQVSDFNTLPSGQPFLVMEYLKGQSLAARARGQALPLEQVVAIMRQVGAALQAAHRAGVVHRDLKPENIFLVPTALGDQVKVLDFGISKLSDSQTVQTTDSVLIGTPLYMSPEQALGNNRDVGPQSDLFSLGSICYELLTGSAPFLADNVAKIVFRIAYEKHPPLVEKRADLPPHVVAAIEHALQKDKAARTASIEAFVEELTGQALATISTEHNEASGVFTPGMPETPSMVSGETRAPGLATPSEPARSPPPRAVSGRRVMLVMLAAVLVIAGVVTKVRMDNWADRAVYRASMVDAGYVMLPDGTFVKDAGGAVDAGEAVVQLDEPDAGPVEAVAAAPADAGHSSIRPSALEPRALPMTVEERRLLAELQGQRDAGDWARLIDRRSMILAELRTPEARSKGLALLVEALCQTRDQVRLVAALQHLKATSPAQRRRSREKCIAVYPDAAALNW